jgi:MscS family membrane protein
VKIIEDIYRGHPMTHDLIVGFNQFGDSALNVQVIHWWKGLDYKQYVAGLQELNMELKRRFDAAMIDFAFPSRTVFLRQEKEWKVELPAGREPKALS